MKTEEYLAKLDSKLDTVIDSVGKIQIENAVQSTDIANIKVDLYEHKEGVKQNRTRIEVVEKQVAFVPQLIKLIVTSGAIVTLILGINKIFGWF